MTLLKTLLTSLFIVFIFNATFAQLSHEKIDQLAEETLSQFNLAGLAIGIVKDGKVFHAKGYGVKSIESKEKIDKYTSFTIASNSKAFTTTSLAKLVEREQLNWDDRVIQYIPEFRMYNDYVTNNFNIRDLITHRSGLGIGAGDLMFIPPGSDFTIQDIITSFQYFEPQSDFRNSYDYDNLLYIVAGEIIARISGNSYSDFIEKNIFQPLGMAHSTCELNKQDANYNLASPHLITNTGLRALDHFQQTGNAAAGGIYSSADDLCKWMLVHLNEGKHGENLEKELFNLATQREMWRIYNSYITYPNDRYDIHFSGYGLGWELADINGNMAVFHGGLLPGMGSYTLLIPDIDLGIVILINSADEVGNNPSEAITYTILDSYLGLGDFGWIEKTWKSLQQHNSYADSVVNATWQKVALNNNKVNTDKYTGIFEDDWFGKVEIYLKNGKLWFKSLRSPLLNGEMKLYDKDTFAIQWEYQDMNGDAFVIFKGESKGNAQAIKMKGISPNIDFSFDFQDLNLVRVE